VGYTLTKINTNLHDGNISLQEAADMLNVSRRLVADARKIKEKAPEKISVRKSD
jgi:predicted DNA-binding protein YlxM (UPF0122 family)